MEGKPAIWVIASQAGSGRQIQSMFEKARLINPIKVITNDQEFTNALACDGECPQVVLLDLGMPELPWKVMDQFHERRIEPCVIALIDQSSENLLDRAYGAGVKSYLRKPFAFREFLERARILELQFALGHDHSG